MTIPLLLSSLAQLDALVATVGYAEGGAGAFAWMSSEMALPGYWQQSAALMWKASWTGACWSFARCAASRVALRRNVGSWAAMPRNALVTGAASATLIALQDVYARAHVDWAPRFKSDAVASVATVAASTLALGALHAIVRVAPLAFSPAVAALIFSHRFDRDDNHFDDTMALIIDRDDERDAEEWF